jgi:plasmid stabilization system protein ParE
LSDNDYDPQLQSTTGNHSPSADAQAADTLRTASKRLSEASDAGREPGMLLDTIGRLVREAPIHSLAIAFLLGIVVARRR